MGRMNARLVVMLVLCTVSFAQPRTWYVERDGSGDFTVIQDAINAASSGDTIQVGPGTYPEYSWAWNNTQWDVYSCAHATQAELTIIGAGQDATIIGGYGPDGHGTLDVVGISMITNGVLYIRDLCVSGLGNAIFFEGAVIDVHNCEISNNMKNGVFAWGREANRFENCIVVDNARSGIYFGDITDNVIVRNCEFRDNYSYAVYVDSCPNTLIENCTVQGGLGGVGIVFWAHVTIRGCHFSDLQVFGILVADSYLDIYDSYIGPSQMGLLFERWGRLRGSNNVLEGGTEYTLKIGTSADNTEIDFHGNHILNGGGPTIASRGVDELCPGEPCIIDLSGNYWGTDDPAQIAAWIEDYYDFPPDDWLHQAIVKFEPFASGGVPTKRMSWGTVKSMFR